MHRRAESLHPDPAVLAAARQIAARTGGAAEVRADPQSACEGADVIATDVWASMARSQRRRTARAAQSYRLDEAKLALGRPGCLVLHCLPAHRGEEITAGVLDGPNSVVWEEAENRLHAQKALITWLLERA